MIARTTSRAGTRTKYYIEKGIAVCDRWKTFENFVEDMAPMPSDEHTLDRIDSCGHYEPSNCRWATRKQQQRNLNGSKIKTFFVDWNGEKVCFMELMEKYRLNADLVRGRLYLGWSLKEAMYSPKGKHRKKDLQPT